MTCMRNWGFPEGFYGVLIGPASGSSFPTLMGPFKGSLWSRYMGPTLFYGVCPLPESAHRLGLRYPTEMAVTTVPWLRKYHRSRRSQEGHDFRDSEPVFPSQGQIFDEGRHGPHPHKRVY